MTRIDALSLRRSLAVVAFLAMLPGTLFAGPEQAVDFESDIQPILRRNCYRCHGQTKAEGGVRFSKRSEALEGNSEEPIFVAGKPEESLIIARLTDPSHGDIMPLDAEPLADAEIQLLRSWIQQGARWPDKASEDRHWAYVKPVRPPVPNAGIDWAINPIDRFIFARMQREGLKPAEREEKERLIRRVSLALIGLPPTVEQVEAFVNDPSPTAYEDLVERLLASNHYGEKWAQHWLDLARYADSNGFQADQYRESWPYRDWVIRAFNSNMPFDQFVLEQLAGDLLPGNTDEQKIATGFHRTTICNVEAGVDPEENRVNQVFDRVNTTGTVFLGTTLECCQCHDHKYDPFTREEYYRLFAYFNNTPLEVELTTGVTYDLVGPKMELPLESDKQAKMEEYRAQVDRLSSKRKKIEQELLDGFAQWDETLTQALSQGPPEWTVLTIDRFEATGGEGSKLLDDGSLLITGPVPDTSTYTLEIEGPIELSGVKIETLTDDSLPGKGPGRGSAERPNFILNEVSLAVVDTSGDKQPVPLHSAVADFSQTNWNINGAIDGDPKTGWGINPQFHKPHWATLLTEKKLTLSAGQRLVMQLAQNYGGGRTIGRLRISGLTGDPDAASLPVAIRDVLSKPRASRSKKESEQLKEHYLDSDARIRKLDRQIAQSQKQIEAIKPTTTLVMVEMEQPRPTYMFQRGNYLIPEKEVTCGTPSVLHPLNPSLPANRLGLAQWLISKDNPLLARVTVNRWWARLFGQGIVTTCEDFGTQCEPPTHPEMLDWLAVEFMESGWSMKHMHRLMVTSATFQQSSRVTSDGWNIDPENKLYARGPRFRLPAETIRDISLFVSGLLSPRMYGPPIMPYQPDGLWRSVGRNQPKWVTATDANRYRRGVYVFWKRAAPYPSFVNFDAPDRTSCTVQRPRSNTPLQALTLLNDPAYAEMALALAQRMMREAPEASVAGIANHGFRLCVSRTPRPEETEALVQLFEPEKRKVHSNPKLRQARLKNLLESQLAKDLNSEDLAAWFIVANVLLNLDETMNL